MPPFDNCHLSTTSSNCQINGKFHIPFTGKGTMTGIERFLEFSFFVP